MEFIYFYIICTTFIFSYIFINARLIDSNDVVVENIVIRFLYAFLIAIFFIPTAIIMLIYDILRRILNG